MALDICGVGSPSDSYDTCIQGRADHCLHDKKASKNLTTDYRTVPCCITNTHANHGASPVYNLECLDPPSRPQPRQEAEKVHVVLPAQPPQQSCTRFIIRILKVLDHLHLCKEAFARKGRTYRRNEFGITHTFRTIAQCPLVGRIRHTEQCHSHTTNSWSAIRQAQAHMLTSQIHRINWYAKQPTSMQ